MIKALVGKIDAKNPTALYTMCRCCFPYDSFGILIRFSFIANVMQCQVLHQFHTGTDDRIPYNNPYIEGTAPWAREGHQLVF